MSAMAVIATLTSVTAPEPNRLITRSLIRLERIVPPDIIIEIIPALSIDTPKPLYMDGHALPNRESGNPKLINAK